MILRKQQKNDFTKILPIIFGTILLLFFLFFNQSSDNKVINVYTADIVSMIALTISISLILYSYKRGELNTEKFIIAIFIFGFAFRLAYALRYAYNINQHDVESLKSSGHLSYIYGIASGKGLPKSNDWQFCHPPLHHILSATLFKLSELLGFSLERSFENIQLLTTFYSSMTMFAGYKILKKFNIKGSNLILCNMLFALHPAFYIFAGSINNDILMFMLSLYGLLYLIEWYNNPSAKYALICGTFLGLAMMTKTSAAVFVISAALTVIMKLVVTNDISFKKVLLQTLCFLCVFLPLGLWYPIRNFLLFQQPLGYVAPLNISNSLYTGNISIFKRIFLPFSLDRFSIYTHVREEYNVWYYILRNSIFGEYEFGNLGVAFFAVVENGLLILSSVAACVYCCLKKFKESIPLLIIFFIQIITFVVFNIKYPFGCTMDFRYITVTLLCGVAFLGIVGDILAKKNNKYSKIALYTEYLSVIMFTVSSAIVYL